MNTDQNRPGFCVQQKFDICHRVSGTRLTSCTSWPLAACQRTAGSRAQWTLGLPGGLTAPHSTLLRPLRRWGLSAAGAGAAAFGGWADEAERAHREAAGASEQSPGGGLLPAELHGPEGVALPEPPHGAAVQSQPGHWHGERSKHPLSSSFLSIFHFTFR